MNTKVFRLDISISFLFISISTLDLSSFTVPDPLAYSASLAFSPSLSKKGKTAWSTETTTIKTH
jgi:hypothetical protein